MPDKAHTTRREERKKPAKSLKEKRRDKRGKRQQSPLHARIEGPSASLRTSGAS